MNVVATTREVAETETETETETEMTVVQDHLRLVARVKQVGGSVLPRSCHEGRIGVRVAVERTSQRRTTRNI